MQSHRSAPRMEHSSSIPTLAAPEAPAELPIAVIGAGFSGTMVAIHLAAHLPHTRPILLCESGTFAGGAAFAAPSRHHLLNVRAANMSAFADRAAHFEDWLAALPDAEAGDRCVTEAGTFVSRPLYGRYLSSLLERAASSGSRRMWMMAGEVVDLVPDGPHYTLRFANGTTMTVAGAVLAMGNVPAVSTRGPRYVANPWTPGALDELEPDRPVLILGTGLTMVDLVLDLAARGFTGPVLALSRRGLLPRRHAPARPWPLPNLRPEEQRSASALLHRIRQEVDRAEARGVDWRAVIDSLRPITAELWHGLEVAERARMLRHLRPYWDVHRHRMAPLVADRFANLRASGFVDLIRGRMTSLGVQDDGVDVNYIPHGEETAQPLRVQRVINATGLASLGVGDSSLVRALCRRGLARQDALRIGLDVTGSLQVVDANGHAMPNLWALGPLVRGVFWECIAVPDIRVQAERVARQVWSYALSQGNGPLLATH